MQITCPVPVSDTEIITLGHGSGGLLTHKLLQAGVFGLLKNEWLDQQHDGASLELNGRVAFSTDSYVVSPIFFPGGNIGDLAVNGTVNDLAMCGASARYLSLSLIIEEGLPLTTFYEVLSSIARAAETARVQIVTGDTKVVEKGKGDQLFINTSGIGYIHPEANIHHSRIKPGDQLIISGPIATHGMAIMSVRKGLEFETTIQSDTTSLKYNVLPLLDSYGSSIHFFRDPTRGGMASVLNEVAEQTNLGFTIQQAALPIDEQVEGACEMLGLDPLYVANEGIFLSVVDREAAEGVLGLLHQSGAARAAIIGEVTHEHPGKVLLRSRIGGHRVVNYLTGEQLPRIC
ncbi:MAG: hydrogenase expression/formation protein HypE [Candidatus Pseudobacter hemicellulosilyticus]|uniref:Hydrogenase expression/formation protein HypE n=1 Tax=Candidatus Pseudobacter hemicellulosilyticus TaxID=3121375 RepID=A0AAJ5WXF6_9BACT|nr:MAG: hydrogenase expression/formation protein HypE [Pseudobacter sp.]